MLRRACWILPIVVVITMTSVLAAAEQRQAAAATKKESRSDSKTPGGQGGKAANPLEVQITEADKGKTFAAAVGKTLVVRLPGNQASGYNWEITKQSSDCINQSEKMQYVRGLDAFGKENVAGVFIFKFAAVKPGKCLLKFAYTKPGEKKPLNYFHVDIVVKRPEPPEKKP